MARQPATGPEFVRYFGPLLEALRALNNSGTPTEVLEKIADDLNLDDAKQNELLASGQSRFYNQVHWARFYLTKEGLLDGSERGVWRLTEQSKKTKLSHADALAIFKRQHSAIKVERESDETADEDGITAAPSNELENAGPIAEESHRAQLTRILHGMSPKGFENFAAFLLRKAGFTEVNVTGKTNDGGIDGIGYLRINPMMTTSVLFQCKRYTDKSVDKDEIMKFQAAVLRERAEKGLYLTTSSFTRPAKDEAMKGAKEIELIDLQRLIDLIELMKLGLKEKTIFVVDASFFEEYGSDK